MEREIFFRGKSFDNGEWVYGSLIISGSEAYIMQQDDFKKGYNFGYVDGSPCYPVDPETVGQFTGMTDMNGNRIFEGDIVHCFSEIDSANMVVIFEEGEFRMVLCEKFKSYVTGGGYYMLRFFAKEIIGNIHDNPELMKGAIKDA